VVLVEGEVAAKPCEVVFQSPQALGVRSNFLRPGALIVLFLSSIL
jgi:hypothetical protein